MNVLNEVVMDIIYYFKPTNRVGLVRFLLLIAAVAAVGIFILNNAAPAPEPVVQERGVVVRSLSSLNNASILSLVGTVKAVDEATIQTEKSGQVTSVRVSLGQYVPAGAIIATLENDSEYASLLQAQGSYEAALANAAQSGFGVEERVEARKRAYAEAKVDIRSAFVNVQDVMQNTVETFFTGTNQATFDLTGSSWEKRLTNYALEDWKKLTLADISDGDTVSALDKAAAVTQRASNLVDVIFDKVIEEERGATTDYLAELAAYKSNLSAARATLTSALWTLRDAKLSVESAEMALKRQEASSLGGSVSAEEARVKQALGALRSAEAAYSKTILRSPVAGEVQALAVKTGDYVGLGFVAARVANQNALEITAYVNAGERERIRLGDDVELEGGGMGKITAIAPAIDPATGKIEIRIGSESETLTNGDTVRLSILGSGEVAVRASAPIVIPVAALKVETDRTVVFTVSSENTLVAHKVTTGSLLGANIVIKDGIASDAKIVIDARGLNEGDKVIIINGEAAG